VHSRCTGTAGSYSSGRSLRYRRGLTTGFARSLPLILHRATGPFHTLHLFGSAITDYCRYLPRTLRLHCGSALPLHRTRIYRALPVPSRRSCPSRRDAYRRSTDCSGPHVVVRWWRYILHFIYYTLGRFVSFFRLFCPPHSLHIHRARHSCLKSVSYIGPTTLPQRGPPILPSTFGLPPPSGLDLSPCSTSHIPHSMDPTWPLLHSFAYHFYHFGPTTFPTFPLSFVHKYISFPRTSGLATQLQPLGPHFSTNKAPHLLLHSPHHLCPPSLHTSWPHLWGLFTHLGCLCCCLSCTTGPFSARDSRTPTSAWTPAPSPGLVCPAYSYLPFLPALGSTRPTAG